MGSIQLTPEQQRALDNTGSTPPRIVDPRTDTAYILVPEVEYESMRDLVEDERTEQAIRGVALRNAAARMDEEP